MSHDSSLEPVLQAVEPAARLIPERYLREVLHYLIDRDEPQPTNPNLPLWVSRETLVAAELLPAHILSGTEAQLLLITDPDDRMIERQPIAEQLRAYWRVLFQAAIMREIDRKIQAGTLTVEVCRERLARHGLSSAREIRYVLETEHLVSVEANDIGRYRAFAAVYLDLATFDSHVSEDYFPSLPHGHAVSRALGEDVDATALLAATRPAGAADPHREPGPDERWLANDTRTIGPPAPRAALSGLLGDAQEAERKGNNVRAAILRTQVAATLTGHQKEQAIGGAHAALSKLVDALAEIFDWDDDTRQEWRQALGPLLEPAAAGFWTRAARCLYELQKIPADLSREVFAVDLAETIRTFGRRPVKRPLPHARPVLILMGLKRARNQMLRAGLGHSSQLRLDRLFHHQIHQLEHHIRHDFTPIITHSLTQAGLVPDNTVEEVARDKIVAELLDRVCDRGYLRIGDLRDAIARNRLKMPDLAGPREFLRGDALLRADINLAYSLDGVYRKGEFYLRWIQLFSALLFGTLLGRLFTLYIALPFGGSFLALMFAEHLWHKVESWVHKPAAIARVAPQTQPGVDAVPDAGGQQPPDRIAGDDVGVDDNGVVWWQPREPGTVAPGDVEITGEGDVVLNKWEQVPLVQAATEVLPSRTAPQAHHGEEPTFLTQTTTILVFGVFLLFLFHLPPFRRAVFLLVGYVWYVVRGLFWDLPRWVWRSQAIREFRQSRGVRLLHRHFWSPLLIAAILFAVLLLFGVRSWFLFRWGWAIWAGLTIAYNTPWGWVLQDRIAEAVSDWWRVVRVNLIPGLIVTILVWFRMLGNWIERRLYAVDEWLRYRGGDSQRSLVFKAILGLIWFPFAYVFRFAFYLLIEPQINPIKHFPVVTVSHKMLLPLVFTKEPNTILSPFGEILAENLGWSVASSNFWAFWIIAGIPGIFGFIAWELLSNWQLYRANRSDRLRPVVLGSHGESMRGLLRPGFHSGTIPKLFKKLRHAERAKAGRLHHDLEHAAEGVHRFIERELIHILARAPVWGGLRMHVHAVRFGCQHLTIDLATQSLGHDAFALSFENVGGQIEATIDQVGWADKLTEPQRAAFVAALRGLLDMAAVERIDGRDRVEAISSLGPAFTDLARRVGWVEWVERWRVPAPV